MTGPVDRRSWRITHRFALAPGSEADRVLHRFQAWRLRSLLAVALLTLVTAMIGTTTRMVGGGPSPRSAINWGGTPWVEAGAGQRSTFGHLAERGWRWSFYAMPVAALLAVVTRARPRTSRAVLVAGWATSYLGPVAIALAPWSWWEADPRAHPLAPVVRGREGMLWGLYYFAVLSPAVLALVPGIIRACLRIKMLLPAAVLPGWVLVAAAPFHGLLALAVFVALAQVAPSPLLLAGILLWSAASLTYVACAEVFVRPIVAADQVRTARRVRWLAESLTLAAVTCLVIHAATWNRFGYRLVGLDPETSLARPWDVARLVLDFCGRSLFMTVLGADLLLRATLSAWRVQIEFAAGPAAADFDRVMARLEAAGAARGDGAPGKS